MGWSKEFVNKSQMYTIIELLEDNRIPYYLYDLHNITSKYPDKSNSFNNKYKYNKNKFLYKKRFRPYRGLQCLLITHNKVYIDVFYRNNDCDSDDYVITKVFNIKKIPEILYTHYFDNRGGYGQEEAKIIPKAGINIKHVLSEEFDNHTELISFNQGK